MAIGLNRLLQFTKQDADIGRLTAYNETSNAFISNVIKHFWLTDRSD